LSTDAILETAKEAGYDLSGLRARLDARDARAASAVPGKPSGVSGRRGYDVVIIGGGAGGLAAASSILKRRSGLNIAVVEPRTEHYYQPGWTLVGGGVFKREQTERQMVSLMPKGVHWIRSACAGFAPESSEVILEDGERLS
jgi:sulfide:quinone oxidoreductase